MSWIGPFLLGISTAGVVLAVGRVGTPPRIERLIGVRPAHVTDPGGTRDGHRLLARVGRSRLCIRHLSARARESLVGSGWNLSREAFAGLRTLAASAGFLTGLLLPMPGPLLAPILSALGIRIPVIVAERAGRRRRAAIDREIPQLLDLLAAASSAGISAQLALRRAAAAVRGPLAVELDVVLRAIDLGARWRDELRTCADRLGLPDLRRTVVALSRTDTLGASLETSTAELAAGVRAARRAAVTERARAAPVKMLFPLVFLVLPAFLLLTVVPVLLTTLQSIR
jgi:tight adherence protein C